MTAFSTMKNYLFFFLSIWALLLTGCQKEAELKDTAYTPYSFSFFYPEDISQNYEFSFNGRLGATGMVPYAIKEGLLEIYTKGNKERVFSQMISLSENKDLQFIKLGDSIYVYDKMNFISFTPSVIFSGQDHYSILFNDFKIQNLKLNYLPKNKSVGKFEIQDENDRISWVSDSIDLSQNQQITLVQIDNNNFATLPEDTVPDPLNKNECKVRLYYPANMLDADSVRVDIYKAVTSEWDFISPLPLYSSVIIKKNNMSDYITFVFGKDASQSIMYLYSLTNANPNSGNEKYVDYLRDQMIIDDSNAPLWNYKDSTDYKKATLLFTDKGLYFKMIMSVPR